MRKFSLSHSVSIMLDFNKPVDLLDQFYGISTTADLFQMSVSHIQDVIMISIRGYQSMLQLISLTINGSVRFQRKHFSTDINKGKVLQKQQAESAPVRERALNDVQVRRRTVTTFFFVQRLAPRRYSLFTLRRKMMICLNCLQLVNVSTALTDLHETLLIKKLRAFSHWN